MYISIIGSPGCGKTTLFVALSGIAADSRAGADPIAVVDVPDERVDELAKTFKPKKTVYTRITLADTVAISEGDMKGDRIGPKAIQQMRESDAFLLVLRDFDDGRPVLPVDEFLTIYNEFIISDMIQIEARMERIAKQSRGKGNEALAREGEALAECLAHLAGEQPLSTAPIFTRDGKELRGFRFLSAKPMMVVVNSSEERAAGAAETVARLRETIPAHVPVVAACGKLEAELALMAVEEREAFMREYGIGESVRGRIARLAAETLGLISFITVGEDECRAWPIRSGATAQEAAAAIHTDLADRFIRAETVSYDDFIACGGFAGCKKKGVFRLEGKGYVVRDGDILSIRAGN
jgi:GTP-binding protein YchF